MKSHFIFSQKCKTKNILNILLLFICWCCCNLLLFCCLTPEWYYGLLIAASSQHHLYMVGHAQNNNVLARKLWGVWMCAAEQTSVGMLVGFSAIDVNVFIDVLLIMMFDQSDASPGASPQFPVVYLFFAISFIFVQSFKKKHLAMCTHLKRCNALMATACIKTR